MAMVVVAEMYMQTSIFGDTHGNLAGSSQREKHQPYSYPVFYRVSILCGNKMTVVLLSLSLPEMLLSVEDTKLFYGGWVRPQLAILETSSS